MRQRVVEMTAAAFDDAEVRFGERGLGLVVGRGSDFAELLGQRLAACIVALGQRDLDALCQRIGKIGRIAPARRKFRDALPLDIRGGERADCGEQISGDPRGFGVGGGSADAVHERGRGGRFERVCKRFCTAHRRRRGEAAWKRLAFGRQRIGPQVGRGHDEQHCDGAQPYASVKPVFEGPANSLHPFPQASHARPCPWRHAYDA